MGTKGNGESIDARLNQSGRWFIGGGGAIGLLVGILTGASNSPIVATVLPLFFALIAGTGGIHILKVDLEKAGAFARIRLLGATIAVLVLACLLGLVYGIAMRSPLGWSALVPQSSSEESATPESWLDDDVSPADTLELFVLRKKLERLGTAPPLIEMMMERAKLEMKDEQPDEDARVSMLAAGRAVSHELMALQPDEEGELPSYFDDLRTRLWAGMTTIYVDENDWDSNAVDSVISVANELLSDADSLRFLLASEFDVQRIARIVVGLRQAIETSTGPWPEESENKLDSLVESIPSARKDAAARIQSSIFRGLASTN